MSEGVPIQEQISNIVYETNNYIYLIQQIPCIYARNAICNMIRERLNYINFLSDQLNDDISLKGTVINTKNALVDSTNIMQASLPASSESGIEQMTQGIQPSVLLNIAGIPAQAGQVNQAVFTPGQLSAYNGINGNPAYVAVNGVVYDVTNIAAWAAATHFGLVAGRDLTQEFASCHAGQNILSKLKVVGRLVNE